MLQDPETGAGDHPRGCGEHALSVYKQDIPVGSSPRMRGALLACIISPTRPRIIPADAGSTPT